MILDGSNSIFSSLNSLFGRLAEGVYVDFLKLVRYLELFCPPFGLDNDSSVTVFGRLNKPVWIGSSPVFYSSFRWSPAPDAQSVVRQNAGPHEISIERDARAAFTLWRYFSLHRRGGGLKGRKRPFSLVTDASHFTGTLAASKGQDAWRGVKSVVCSGQLRSLCHCRLIFFQKFLSFLLSAFSALSNRVGALIGGIRIGAGPKGRLGDDHFPEYPRQSAGHGRACLSFDAGTFDQSLVAFPEAGIEFGHLEGGLAECPAEGGRPGFGDLAGVLLPIGYMRSLGQAAPTRHGIGVFEPVEIPEFSQNDKPQYLADAFGSGQYFEGLGKVVVGFENGTNAAKDRVPLSLNDPDTFVMLPEHSGLNDIEFFAVGQQPAMQCGGTEGVGASGIGLIQFPFDDCFNGGGLLSDPVPLSAKHPQMPNFQRRNIRCRDELIFQDISDFGGHDLVGVGQTGTQFAQVQSVDQVNLVGQGLEHVPEPVIRAHRFDADAERFFEGLDKSCDFSSAMVGNGHFVEGA